MDEEDYVETCSICLLDLIPENKDEAENLGILSCNHKFHEQCIKLWSEKACTCPMDRGVFNEIKIYNYKEEYLSTYVIKKKDKEEEIEIEDLSFCIICGSSEHEEIMLLCDICDAPYHTTCLGLNSIPIGNWYCPNCINENPALASSMVSDNDSQESELVYETAYNSEILTPSTSTTRRRTRGKSNENTTNKATKKSRSKKTKSRTVANSNNKRIKASRSIISKLRKEILQRRQYSIMINKRLLEETALINIPRNTYDDYFDAYRASSSDNVSSRSLNSLREKLNYETKRKYTKMLDTQTVNEIYEKPSSYNRNSEYDLIWRQANLAKKIKSNSSSSNTNNSLKINENIPSSSLKRPNIALRRMKEQKANQEKNNLTSRFTDYNKNLASSSNSSISTNSRLNGFNHNNYNYNNNNNNNNNNNLKISKIASNSFNSSSNHNNIKDKSSSNNNKNQHLSSHKNSDKLNSNNTQKYHSIPDTNKDKNPYNSIETPTSNNDSISSNEFINDLFNDNIIPNSYTSSKDHKGYSSREIFKFIRPYIQQRVKSRYITREQYKKLTRDTTYYVIKRLSNDYKGEHKLNYDELKEDYLIDHSYSNKIIINFINYNIIKFLEINKKRNNNSSSKELSKHPKPI